MSYVSVIGISASVFTSLALIPQLVTLLREKTAKGVSVIMLVVLLIGLILWIYYGVLRSDPIIIISNSFATIFNIATGALAIRYSSSKKTGARR
jgi:MtN3 and saliva related transmembrane protein